MTVFHEFEWGNATAVARGCGRGAEHRRSRSSATPANSNNGDGGRTTRHACATIGHGSEGSGADVVRDGGRERCHTDNHAENGTAWQGLSRLPARKLPRNRRMSPVLPGFLATPGRRLAVQW